MLLDKFQKITGARRRIDCNAVLTNIDAVGEKYLKRVACSNGEIKKVSCVLPIPKSVNEQCREWFGSRPADREEAYFIKIGEKKITIYSNSRRAALYAANRIKAEGAEGIAMGAICNYPDVACRMIKLYLPSEENIPFFKELIDLCVYYGYNTVMLEVGGAMEYHSHPEINEGWRAYSRESSDHINHRGKNPYFPFRSEDSYYLKNSIHCENAGGGVLTKERVRELVQYCKERYLEVIPEVPSFSHSDYLLTRHHELAERQEDIKKIYCFLKERGVATMLWSDKLIKCIDKQGIPWGGARKEVRHPKTGKLMEVVEPTYTAIDQIPTDISILHWYWSIEEQTETDFIGRGFWTAFANLEPLRIKHLAKRLKKGIRGICVSNWSKVDELHVQRNGIYLNLALAALAVWSGQFEEERLEENILIATGDLYRYRTGGAAHKAEIVHTFLKNVPFELYLDGYEVDREKNIIGDYVLEFEDGSCERTPIEYGKTVGYKRVERKRRESKWCDSYEPDNRLFEPAYSCDYEFDGGKTYYRFAILSDKRMKSLRVAMRPEYEGMLEIKRCIIDGTEQI